MMFCFRNGFELEIYPKVIIILNFENGAHGLFLGGVEGGVEEEDAGGARQAVRAVPDGAAPAQAAAQRQ